MATTSAMPSPDTNTDPGTIGLMDDNYRLIKLISLVGWTDRTENKWG
jgi:hypothetical protein